MGFKWGGEGVFRGLGIYIEGFRVEGLGVTGPTSGSPNETRLADA